MTSVMKYLTKENIKTFLIVLLSLLFTLTLFKKQPIASVKQQSSVEYKDKNGNQYSQIPVENIEKKQLNSIIDSLKLSLKNKGKIEQITIAPIKIDTFIKEIPVYLKDGVIHFEYSDNYLTLKGEHDSNKLNIYYQSKDTISFVTHTKSSLFKKKVTYVDVINRNPFNHIKTTSSLQLKEKKSILVLGPSIFYNPLQNNFGVGISLTYNLLSFKK